MSELIERLNQQAKEIAGAGHNGWGNTMLDASETIEKIAQEAADYCKMLESTISEQKRTILDMEARQLQLIEALKEAQEWNWLDDHGVPPDEVMKQIFNAVNCPSSTSEWTARFVSEWVRENWKPFGVWHQGDTEDESDFHMGNAVDAEDCKHCTALYAIPASPESDIDQATRTT